MCLIMEHSPSSGWRFYLIYTLVLSFCFKKLKNSKVWNTTSDISNKGFGPLVSFKATGGDTQLIGSSFAFTTIGYF